MAAREKVEHRPLADLHPSQLLVSDDRFRAERVEPCQAVAED